MKETILIDYPHADMVRVRLNRPETGNSYDDEMICALITAFDEFNQDEDLKLVWITAEGEDFCRGLDSNWHQQRLDAGRAEHQNDSEQLSRLFHTLYQMPIPTLATVRGEANAAAVGIISCCDIVLACETSSFTIMEMEYGPGPCSAEPVPGESDRRTGSALLRPERRKNNQPYSSAAWFDTQTGAER